MLLKKGVTIMLEKEKKRVQHIKKKCFGYMAIYSVKATKRKRVCHLRIHCHHASILQSLGRKTDRNAFRFVLFRDRCFREITGGKSAGWVLKQVRTPFEDPSAQSVLVVRLLLARAGDAVLGLAGARAQAVQSPTILCIINVVFKEKLFHPEESHAGEQRV